MSLDAHAQGPHADKSSEPPAHGRVEAVIDWGKRFGIAFEVPERLLAWWKLIGFRKAAVVMLAVTIPLLKYEWLPEVASGALTGLASAYGVNLKVGEWSGDLYDLKATAHDVTIETHGQYAENALLHADAIVLDLGLWRRLRTGHWIQRVEIEGPRLYLEHTLSGRWNWEDVIDVEVLTGRGAPSREQPATELHKVRDTAPAPDQGSHRFEVPNLTIKGMRVQWVENLPGRSGGGLIHSSRAILYIDDVGVVVDDLSGPVDERDAPTKFSIEGRTADGRISVNGRANLFRWAGQPSSPGVLNASTSSVAWAPKAAMKIYLENVGTPALAQMVPSPSLVSTAGTMTGTIELAVLERRVDCRSDLMLTNVAFAANPDAAPLRGRVDVVQRELVDFRANGRVVVGCEGDLSNASYRPFYALQTRLTQEAVRTAAPVVRDAAANDYRRLGGQLVDAGLQDVANGLAQKAGETVSRYVGPQAGAALSNSLNGGSRSGARQGTKSENPVSKGAKGVGSAFKRLFGGGKKKPNTP